MKAYRVEVWAHSFLTSILDRVSGQMNPCPLYLWGTAAGTN